MSRISLLNADVQITPRDYQEASLRGVLDAFRQVRTTLVDLPTGTGKTIVFSLLVALARQHNRRVLILVNRDSLVTQTVHRLKKDVGITASIEKASTKAETWAPVVVASVQTLGRKGKPKVVEGETICFSRIERWDRDAFNLIVIDEGHHATAASYKMVLDYFRSAKVVGVTATSDRGDNNYLQDVYETTAYRMTFPTAVQEGWLVPVRPRFRHVPGLDLSELRRVGQDLDVKEQAKILRNVDILEKMAFPTADEIGTEKAVVFNARVNDSRVFCELLRKCGITAECVYHGHGMKMARRREIISAYKRGDIQVLCNVDCLTEGFDDPQIRYVVMGRWTLSPVVYAQQVGRGTRPLPGLVDGLENAQQRRDAIANSQKPHVDVIDFAGNTGEHKLMGVPSLFLKDGEDPEVADRANKLMREDETLGAEDAMNIARQLIAEAKRRSPKKLAYQDEFVDPFYRTAPGQVLDLFGIRRELGLFPKKPTVHQLERLRQLGVDKAADYTREEAHQVLLELEARQKRGKARIRQIRALVNHGYDRKQAMQLTFEDASKKLFELQNNNWQPVDLGPSGVHA